MQKLPQGLKVKQWRFCFFNIVANIAFKKGLLPEKVNFFIFFVIAVLEEFFSTKLTLLLQFLVHAGCCSERMKPSVCHFF